jgi:hypothetical protein
MTDPLRLASRRRCLPLSSSRRLLHRRITVRPEELNGLMVEVESVNWSASRVRSESRDRVRFLPGAPWQHTSQRMLEQPPNLPALASEERSTEHIQVCEQAGSAVYGGLRYSLCLDYGRACLVTVCYTRATELFGSVVYGTGLGAYSRVRPHSPSGRDPGDRSAAALSNTGSGRFRESVHCPEKLPVAVGWGGAEEQRRRSGKAFTGTTQNRLRRTARMAHSASGIRNRNEPKQNF